ncbi:MAG: DUF5677 domain-containing protein [Deltaproteobacteria bacterium]|nr:DUF5677 domain-containing protein [Deltaproteobacteria bacterium]
MLNIELIKKPNQDHFKSFLAICLKLIDLNSIKTKKIDPPMFYRQEMFVKFSYHLATIIHIEKGIMIAFAGRSHRLYDYSSVNVLTRALLETFLTYYYVFCDAKDEDESRFRYWNWWIDGLNSRQQVKNIKDPLLIGKLENERRDIDDCTVKIKSTKAYSRLSAPQKKEFEKKRKWIRPGWIDIAVKAGMKKSTARHAYSYFSSYAHTNSLSILQFSQATISNKGKEANPNMLKLLFMVAAMFIDEFAKYFQLKDQLSEYEQELVANWLLVAKNMSVAE